MNTIEVMQIGSLVLIGEEIDAKITGVLVRDKGYFQYECSWWDGKKYQSEWISPAEVRPLSVTETLKIGFNGKCWQSV